jgi:molecular chaperone GrpE
MTQRPHNDKEDHLKRASTDRHPAEESADEPAASADRDESQTASSVDKKVKRSDKSVHEEQLKSENAELKDRYVRLLAEYDNYRKRTQKERESLYSDAVVEVTKEWLPVIDNVERAICFSAGDTNEAAQNVADGVKLIHRQIQEVFAKLGIEEIDCNEGGCFDPNLHEAVLHVEDSGLSEQCIAQVFQKGYRTSDRIIRHSVVKVAN